MYEGVGIYQTFVPSGQTITTTTGSTSITITYGSLTVTGVVGGSNATCAEGSFMQCQSPVQIFKEPGPITSAEQYCTYYREYYGTSNCPISQGGTEGLPMSLLNLAWVTGNPTMPLVDVRVVLGLIVALGLILYAQRQK